MLRRLSLSILILLAVLSIVSINFPLISYAASSITITDNVEFKGKNTPTEDIILLSTSSNPSSNNYVGVGTSTTPTIKGNVATFIVPITAYNNKTIPNGTLYFTTAYNSSGSINIQNGSGSATINSVYIPVPNGSYAPGKNYKPGCYFDPANGSITKQQCSGNDTSGNTINSTKNCYVKSDIYLTTGWMIANCNGLVVSSKTPDGTYIPNLSNLPGVKSTTPAPSTTPTCQSGGVLDWVYCAIFNSLSGISQTVLKDFLIPQLRISNLCFHSAQKCGGNPTYQIWSSFRVYGDIVLIIALLVAVFSEIIGGGLMDAYTIRKMLPRILVAAILINLSIYIVAAAVDIANIIGGSIGVVITAPLQTHGAFTVQANGVVGLSAIGGGILGLSIAGFAGLFSLHGGAMLIDIVVVPLLLIILSIVLTITIRKMAIIFLIIVSPLAFALYCLPNTEKYFKKWWSVLEEMLMIYPIIIIMFALSSVMSVLVQKTSTGLVAGAFDSILSLIFTVLPLALIPFSFKLAGDTIGRLHGAIEGGRSKISGMHENRRKRAKEKFAAYSAGHRSRTYDSIEASGLGNQLRKVPGIGRAYGTKSSKAQQKVDLLAAATGQTPGGKALENDQEALRAATYNNRSEAIAGLTKRYVDELGQTEQQAQLNATKAADRAQASTGYGRTQAMWAAKQLGVIGTGYDKKDDMVETIARVAGGSEELKSSLSGSLNSINKQVGRHDLAPGFQNLKNLVDLQERKNNGEAVDTVLNAALDTSIEQAWGSGSLYQHANDKPMDLKNTVPYYERLLRSDNIADQDKALVFFEELNSLKQNATGDVRDIAVKALEDNRVAINTRKTEVNEGVKTLTGTDMSREQSIRRSVRAYNPEEDRIRAASGESGAPGSGAPGSGAPGDH